MMKSKVAVVRCNSYDQEEVYNAVNKGINLLGGVERFVKKGEKILFKPNVLIGDLPAKAATTNPALLRAAGQIFLNAGARLFYGDSPGFGAPEGQCKRAGLGAVAEELGIAFADFQEGKEIAVEIESMPFLKKILVANAPLEADGIVNLPKMKAHGFLRVTGAVKNLFGCIPGLNKGNYHVKLPNPIHFSRALVELTKIVKPRLHIMDGIIAMEGNGPRGGNPVPMNVLLFSEDPVALDSVMCRLMNLDPAFVPYLPIGAEEGIGKYRDEEIEIAGDFSEDLVNKDFDVVRAPIADGIRKSWLFNVVKKYISDKPVIEKNLCVKCGVCVQVCPVEPKALNWTKKGKQIPPVYNYNNCIRCFCCQELCPEKAISVKRPWLGRKFLK